jgi:16S rRNA (cytidine1402-2'-O)-methyltransferase
MSGRLFLVPTPLDFGCDTPCALPDVLPLHTIRVAARLSNWICENAKTARAFLKRIGELAPLPAPVMDLSIREIPRDKHRKGESPETADIATLLGPVFSGQDMGLVSEAGMPAIADPGAAIVRAAHDRGVEVVPLVGPVSMLLALAGSGLNGQNFAFVGYLPVATKARVEKIRALESLAWTTGQTQLFIEVPYRNAVMLGALLQTLRPATRLAVGCGLTLGRQWIRSASVQGWSKLRDGMPVDLPAIFSIGR